MTEAEYEVAWTPSASRMLNRLPEKVATAAIEFVYGPPAANPRAAESTAARIGRYSPAGQI